MPVGKKKWERSYDVVNMSYVNRLIGLGKYLILLTQSYVSYVSYDKYKIKK
jgi:hypothetical protein